MVLDRLDKVFFRANYSHFRMSDIISASNSIRQKNRLRVPPVVEWPSRFEKKSMIAQPKKLRLPNGLVVYSLSRSDTQAIYEEIFENDIYRRHGVTISDGDQILDVGANTGLLEVFLHHLGKSVSVHAFEPIPDTFETLRRNMELFPNPKVQIHNCGISGKAGTATFAFYPRASCISTQFPNDSPEEKARTIKYIYTQMDRFPTPAIAKVLRKMFGFTRPWIAERIFRYFDHRVNVTCQLRTLSEVIAEHQLDRIDLLKVDVERAEMDILQSIPAPDWSKVRQAIVEVHDVVNVAPIETMLRQHGFRVIDDFNPLIPDIHLLYALR